jgi:hypothetical protein
VCTQQPEAGRNFPGRCGDYPAMTHPAALDCDQARLALSARLDGEPRISA